MPSFADILLCIFYHNRTANASEFCKKAGFAVLRFMRQTTFAFAFVVYKLFSICGFLSLYKSQNLC